MFVYLSRMNRPQRNGKRVVHSQTRVIWWRLTTIKFSLYTELPYSRVTSWWSVDVSYQGQTITLDGLARTREKGQWCGQQHSIIHLFEESRNGKYLSPKDDRQMKKWPSVVCDLGGRWSFKYVFSWKKFPLEWSSQCRLSALLLLSPSDWSAKRI